MSQYSSPHHSLSTYARHFSRSRNARLQNASSYDTSQPATPVGNASDPAPVEDHTLDEGNEDEYEDENGDGDTAELEEEDEEEDEEGEAEGEEDIEAEDKDSDIDIDGVDGEGAIEEGPMDIDPPFDAAGLKEIGNLASWTVSTCKPGCGVEALRNDDTNLFWQSDGPQPHHLNIHFSRLVQIRSIRLYLDFEADESYTPTRITLLAGTGYHDLLPFSSLEFAQPKGWIDVPLEGVGGGPDGNTLRAFLVQVKVVENHQNGKDTHLRGLKIYARDEKVGKGGMEKVNAVLPDEEFVGRRKRVKNEIPASSMLTEPDWMREIEMR